MINELKVISDPISAHIWGSLHNHAFKEALFAAERLFAETKNEESLYLLATCFYRMNRPKQVIRLLNSNTFSSSKIRYLLSKCYFDCDMLTEAENSLLESECSSKSLIDTLLDFGEQACYAFLLLGDVYKLQSNFQKAQMCYKECLKLNPFMWTAFENLCSISEFIDPDEVFKVNPSLGLFTPTFTVVGQALSTTKSPVNVNIKAERDKLGSRENVNPNGPVKEVPDLPLDSDAEKMAAPFSTTQVVKSTYVSQCTATNQDFSTTHPLLPDDLSVNFTPVGFPVTTITPSAPMINRDELKTKKLSATDNTTSANEIPSFGFLSTIPQSPMFACLPVFSRLDLNSTFAVSVSSWESIQPFRLAFHQATANRRLSGRQAPPSSSQLQSTILFNTSTTNATSALAQWRSKDAKVSTPMATTASVSPSGGIFGHNCTRVSGITPLPPWLPGSPISVMPAAGSLGSTSTPAGNGTTAFSMAKPLILDELSESTNVTTSRVNNIPMEVNEAAEDLCRDSSASNDGGGFVEPRTRAQKARAAASASQRRSTRLSRAPKTSTDDPMNEESKKSFVRLVTTTKLPSRPSTGKEEVSEYPKVVCTASGDRSDPRTEAISAYLHLLRCLGRSFSLLTQHDYKNAVAILSELPFEHLATGRILAWAARAHVDAVDYPKAHRIFSELRRIEPWQLHGMDLYSTVLWYQEADQELSQLASDLLTLDRSAPEPWTAAGNYYSLQREHDIAIRFFRRALQVCPTDAYACTLLGHEYISVDNLDRAASAFRHALRLDGRSYSARFGLSNVYFKQDYFGLADAHLVRAISLFPNSSLLLTHLGAIRARIGRLDDEPGSAIDCLNRAVNLNPTSPIALYHRACVLSSLGRYQDAIEELERLMLITPHEAMIYFMLGHAYQKVGNSPQAMIYYSWAMELDPKGVNTNLRDIMTSVPTGPQQPSLGPFACAISTSASGLAASEASSSAPIMTGLSSRSYHRRGGAGSGAGRSRRSTRGRQATVRGAPPRRLFLTSTLSAVTTAVATPTGVDSEVTGDVAPGDSSAGANFSLFPGGGTSRSIFRFSWNRRRGAASLESGGGEVEAMGDAEAETEEGEREGDGEEEEEEEEETMDMGDD
ncbi:Cell division cycle protein 27 -like protein [Echinococcus granulosus]|uniref:Cell division cycle protein 27 homolog n=2 Tax=Echinococcus granulosus TaxID=6210 RepID=A0A068WXX2_ECHGR|nr:Cell division cycle protein 27 -like protein [Echinococcus granulosus]CDS22549.1 cell division cycle protein 27 [Echinococcus granulosus]